MNEQINPPVTGATADLNWKRYFTTVTPSSKFLAMLVFVALPFAGFGLGLKYGTEMPSLTPTLPTETVSVKTYANSEYGYEFTYPISWRMVEERQAWSGDYLPDSRTFVAIWPTTYPAQDFSARVDVYEEKLFVVMNESPFLQGHPFTLTNVNGIPWIVVQGLDYEGKPTDNFSYLTEGNNGTYEVGGSAELTRQILSQFKIFN